MPIRFRCAYCNQLMGISTRKAGTVVKCPKCAGEIIVPSPDAPAAEEPAEPSSEPPAQEPAASPPDPAAAFEEKGFEEYFNEATNGSAGATAPVRTETAPPEPAPDVAALPPPSLLPPPPPPIRRGLFLTLPVLVISVLVIILLLVLMFVLGVMIGRHAAPRDSATQAARLERSLAHL